MKKILSSIVLAGLISTVNADTFNLHKGWNLIGSSYPINIKNSEFNSSNIAIIFTYKNNKWFYYSNKYKLKKYPKINVIPANQGAWVYSKTNLVINYPTNIKFVDINNSEANLTYEQKYALAYMWNEEKMAKDLYLALNDLYSNKTLYNIGSKSETQHEASVENLAKAYDLNLTNLNNFKYHFDANELAKYGRGKFFVSEVQETYNKLYEKGSKSLVDALEVGCMVEVTDINDLDKWLDVVKDQPVIVSVFEHLRSGSYNHYWAFDNALKNLGVSEGCCVLGDEYCKTPEEYPTNEKGYSEEKGNKNKKNN